MLSSTNKNELDEFLNDFDFFLKGIGAGQSRSDRKAQQRPSPAPSKKEQKRQKGASEVFGEMKAL